MKRKLKRRRDNVVNNDPSVEAMFSIPTHLPVYPHQKLDICHFKPSAKLRFNVKHHGGVEANLVWRGFFLSHKQLRFLHLLNYM